MEAKGQRRCGMRIAFTIIFNGLHHLKHNDQYKFLSSHFDYWVVVEGASKSSGSTSWCKKIPANIHKNGASVDGTREFLDQLSSDCKNVIYIPSNGFWESKDHQVNVAIEEIKKITKKCFLWQVDIDEQWKAEDLGAAEEEILLFNYKVGSFRANCYIGKNLMAIGDWGECSTYGYTRLWQWEGEKFIAHEPPILDGLMGKDALLLSPRFNHYNYYFEKDVLFKDQWYGGHEQIYDRWKLINKLPRHMFPLHISNLITGPWGKSSSSIIYVD